MSRKDETTVMIMSVVIFTLLISGVFVKVLGDMKDNYKISRSLPCTK